MEQTIHSTQVFAKSFFLRVESPRALTPPGFAVGWRNLSLRLGWDGTETAVIKTSEPLSAPAGTDPATVCIDPHHTSIIAWCVLLLQSNFVIECWARGETAFVYFMAGSDRSLSITAVRARHWFGTACRWPRLIAVNHLLAHDEINP